MLTHGLHYGGGVFEGERVHDGHVFKLTERSQRLHDSARELGFGLPLSVAELDRATRELVAREGIGDGYVRPVAWRGSERSAWPVQAPPSTSRSSRGSGRTSSPPTPRRAASAWATVIDLARELGIRVVERDVRPEELGGFDECFLTGTAYEVQPVRSIDAHAYEAGRTTTALREAYAGPVRSAHRAAAVR
ncbi:aminotransferase class IV [Streptomyces sp. NPDC097981]|uniref:aminotransferase class IV n=1 Tax=Streptomyces sp. NPDC097981 TaxID=3155428 RepID=UPI00332AB83F